MIIIRTQSLNLSYKTNQNGILQQNQITQPENKTAVLLADKHVTTVVATSW